MQIQQQPCNRDEIEEVVRLLLGHPTSLYVHHPTLFINNSPPGSATVVTDDNDDEPPSSQGEVEGVAVDGTPRREGGEEKVAEREENRENNQNKNKNQCDEFFKLWMEKHAIDGSPTAEVIETNPLQQLLAHYKKQSIASDDNNNNQSSKKSQMMMMVPNDPTTLVVKRYRRSGIHASAIPLGERAVYVCAQRAVEEYISQHHKDGDKPTTARSIFPQLFLPLFVTTMSGSEDLRDTSTSTTPATKKRKKSAITAAVKSLKPSFSAPDFPTNTSSPNDGGIMTEDSNEPQSWPNLLRATGVSPTTSCLLISPSKVPPPNTVVMAKYCGSLTTLLSLGARTSSLQRGKFAAAFKEESSAVYCRELCREPVLDYKVLVSMLYLITRGLIQIHNLAQGHIVKLQQQQQQEEEHTTADNDSDSTKSLPTIGFVHNDLRLPNILLSHEGNVGLVDFELATRIVLQEDGTPKLCTKSTQEAGNHNKFVGFSYLPPDHVPCDVWTLGIVALDLLTGCHTFFLGENHLPEDAQRWSDGPTPIRTEVNHRLKVLQDMMMNDDDVDKDPNTIIAIEEDTPLDSFFADCLSWITTKEPAKRLLMLHHPSEGVCSKTCLCTHKLFTSTLQLSREVSMEQEAMSCIRAYFSATTPPPSSQQSTTSTATD